MNDARTVLAEIQAAYVDWYEDDAEVEGSKAFEIVREHVPTLLEAIEAVLELHGERRAGPFSTARMIGADSECRACGREWPCPTVQAINGALTV